MDTTELFRVPMEVCWQFEYAIAHEKLETLYTKAKNQQWDAAETLPWSTLVDPSKPLVDEERFGFSRIPFIQRLTPTQRERFTAHVSTHRLSQFLHGEQGALMTASTLTHAVPDYEAKLFSASQTMDEARHVEAFQRYIAKVGQVYPVTPSLKALIDDALKADHWVKTAIGMNMVVEGLALGSFHNMRRQTDCALLKSLLELVLRDEARHVAFGHLYIKSAIAHMHQDDREDVAQFSFQAIMHMANTTGGPQSRGKPMFDPSFHQALVDAGIDPHDFALGMKEARELGVEIHQAPGTVHAFRDLMLPALVRVGAVTERTAELFAEAGIRMPVDFSVLETVQNHGTDAKPEMGAVAC